MKQKLRPRIKYWFRGKLWGTIEHGKLELSPESKLLLTKENNRRVLLEEEIRRLEQHIASTKA